MAGAMTAPTELTATAYTSTSVTLGWVEGSSVDHYDVYRGSIIANGIYSDFGKINSAAVEGDATSYVDNSTNSTSAPSANVPYLYIVFSISAAGAMIPSNPAPGTAFDGTDIVGPIREAIIVRMAAVLTSEDSAWKAMDYLLEPEKMGNLRRDKTYGLEVQPGAPVEGPIGKMTVAKGFRILLCRQLTRKEGTDGDLNDRMDELEKLNEMCQVDLTTSKLGLGSQVVMVKRNSQTAFEVSRDENMIIMTQDITVLYRISV